MTAILTKKYWSRFGEDLGNRRFKEGLNPKNKGSQFSLRIPANFSNNSDISAYYLDQPFSNTLSTSQSIETFGKIVFGSGSPKNLLFGVGLRAHIENDLRINYFEVQVRRSDSGELFIDHFRKEPTFSLSNPFSANLTSLFGYDPAKSTGVRFFIRNILPLGDIQVTIQTTQNGVWDDVYNARRVNSNLYNEIGTAYFFVGQGSGHSSSQGDYVLLDDVKISNEETSLAAP